MNDIEIARRLIERLGGAYAAIVAITVVWDKNPELARRYSNHSEKFAILHQEIRHHLKELRSS